MRSAGISLCGVIYMYMGQNFRVMFDSEKPALLKELDAEIEKVCHWASAKKKKKYRLHWKKYCGIIGFRVAWFSWNSWVPLIHELTSSTN